MSENVVDAMTRALNGGGANPTPPPRISRTNRDLLLTRARITNALRQHCPDKPLLQGLKVVKKIGEGGFGKVFKVTNSAGTIYALKEIQVDPERREFFMTEVRNLEMAQAADRQGCIEHNICLLAWCMTPNNILYILMPFVDGEELFTWRMEVWPTRTEFQNLMSELSEDVYYTKTATTMFDIMKQLAKGLRLLHARGLVHRDIKLENIMISPKSVIKSILQPANVHIKLIDLGLGCTLDTCNYAQRAGTPNYMPPDIISGRYRSDTPEARRGFLAADVFALGVTFYHLIRAEPLFYDDAGNDQAYNAKRSEASYLKDPKFSTGCADLDRLILRMTKADPTDRATLPQIEQALTEMSNFTRFPNNKYLKPFVVANVSTRQQASGLVLPEIKEEVEEIKEADIVIQSVNLDFIQNAVLDHVVFENQNTKIYRVRFNRNEYAFKIINLRGLPPDVRQATQDVATREITALMHTISRAGKNGCLPYNVCIKAFKISKNEIVIVTPFILGVNMAQWLNIEPTDSRRQRWPSNGEIQRFVDRMGKRRFVRKGTVLFYRLMQTCAEAVYALHAKNLVHRDIKPDHFMVGYIVGNILNAVNRQRELANILTLTLIDLKATCSTVKGTKDSVRYVCDPELLSGTAGYVAPELLNPVTVSSLNSMKKADIFALGVTFHEMVFKQGIVPDNASVDEMLRLTKTDEYVVMRDPKEVAFNNLLQHMLAYDPTNRPDAGQVIQELQSILRNYPQTNDDNRGLTLLEKMANLA